MSEWPLGQEDSTEEVKRRRGMSNEYIDDETGGNCTNDYEFFAKSAGGHDGCTIVFGMFA